MMRTTLLLLVLPVAAGLIGFPAARADTTVIVVRHAEKKCTGGDDATLKPAGYERAKALVGLTADAGVSIAVYSRARRTRLTLEPSIEALGLGRKQVFERTTPEQVVRQIRKIHDKWTRNEFNGTVIVAGHSNTVPRIVEELGSWLLCPPFEAHPEWGCVIPDSEFHHLFVVTIPTEGPPTTEWKRYGAPSLPGAGCRDTHDQTDR